MFEALTWAENVFLPPAASSSLRRKTAAYFIEGAALFALLGGFAWVYLTHGVNVGAYFAADALYLPALMQDLIEDGGRYSDWNLTPSPYYLPDWPMFAISHVVTGGNTYYSILAFSLLQFSGAYLLMRAIYSEVFADGRAPVFALVCVAVLISMCIDAVPIVQDARISGHHFGEFLVILLALWMSVQILRSPTPQWPRVAGLCLIAFLTGLSDALFVIIHYGFAAILTADFLWRRTEVAGRQFLAVGLLPGLSAFIGSRFTLLAMPADNKFDYRFGFEYFDGNVDRVEILTRAVLNADILPMLVIPAFYVATLGVLAWHFWRGVLRDHTSAYLVLTFAMAAMLLILTMALFINVGIPGRYVTPAFVLPIALLFVPLVLVRNRLVSLGAPILVGALAAGSIGVTVAANGAGFHSGFYPGDVACIDREVSQRGLTFGISQYWTAKYVTALSHDGIRLVSVHGDLRDNPWINSSAWYRSAYDFAIVEESASPNFRLDAAKLRSLNGEPAFTARCGGYTILGYPSGGLMTAKPDP